MPFEFIQIPANGQGSAKEELNKLLRNGRIASVKKEFVSNGEDSLWAFCIEFVAAVGDRRTFSATRVFHPRKPATVADRRYRHLSHVRHLPI